MDGILPIWIIQRYVFVMDSVFFGGREGRRGNCFGIGVKWKKSWQGTNKRITYDRME